MTRRATKAEALTLEADVERAAHLCAWEGDQHGPDSHANVRVEASCTQYLRPGVAPSVWTTAIHGAGTERAPFCVHLDIEAHFFSGQERDADMGMSLPDVRSLPTLIDALTLLVDRARRIGMIPPDETT